MKRPNKLIVLLLVSFTLISQVEALKISEREAFLIADKIWQNEGAGKQENLTCWNKGEEFASLGIGHFIWYPQNQPEKFQQTFPRLLSYLESQNVALPPFLKGLKSCPWNSREEFYAQINAPQMVQLRQFLYDTRQHQALFMAQRLVEALPKIIEGLTPEEKKSIQKKFQVLLGSPKGLYALLDYLNFKGDGSSLSERYKGEGWGLRQVLQQADLNSPLPLKAFVEAAKTCLIRRVENSPKERNESRWLKGWLNRLDTYLK